MGLANYLLEKAAGLKQVKRMLEAAQKSPDAAGRLGDLVNWDVKAFDVTERLG